MNDLLRNPLILILFLILPSVGFAIEVPSLKKLDLDPQELGALLEERSLVILYPPASVILPGDEKSREVRFVSVVAKVRAGLADVTRTVTDFLHYSEFMPQVKKTRVRSDGTYYEVEYDLRFELPVVNMNLNYTVLHRWSDPGTLTFERIRGEIGHIYGKWEFFPQGTDSTIVAYTVWSDTESMGFIVRTMLSAQPDLRIAIPISYAVVVVQAIRDRVEGKRVTPIMDPKNLPRSPRIPLLTRGSLPFRTLTKLSREGTLLFVHPMQWIQKEGTPLDLLFVTGVKLSPYPPSTTTRYTTSFARYPEFFDQVRKAIVQEIPNGWVVEWKLKLGFGILSVPVDYTLRYEWIEPQRILRYYRVAGDLEYIYGSWEFLEDPEGKGTFIFYTTASQLGEKAPAILKLGNLIPNRQLVVGASASSVILEKFVEWIGKEIEEEKGASQP
jgi:ribosome-associated toxin RatA of RatAB toxin-antitoxin module